MLLEQSEGMEEDGEHITPAIPFDVAAIRHDRPQLPCQNSLVHYLLPRLFHEK